MRLTSLSASRRELDSTGLRRGPGTGLASGLWGGVTQRIAMGECLPTHRGDTFMRNLKAGRWGKLAAGKLSWLALGFLLSTPMFLSAQAFNPEIRVYTENTLSFRQAEEFGIYLCDAMSNYQPDRPTTALTLGGAT